jgi:hypothetical protein
VTFRFGVILTALALLFFLTALALRAAGLLAHPYRVALALAATLAVGVALLLE